MNATRQREDYQRLGDEIRAARRQLGYKTRKAFAEHLKGEVTERTLSDLENGNLGNRKGFSPDTLAAIEEALGWPVGTTRAILLGKPSRATNQSRDVVEDPEQARSAVLESVSDEELLAEIARRFNAAATVIHTAGSGKTESVVQLAQLAADRGESVGVHVRGAQDEAATQSQDPGHDHPS